MDPAEEHDGGPEQTSFSLSVVVPNLNDAHFLPSALDALLSQSQAPDEIIVVDDASSDGSREIIRQYASRFPSIRPIFRDRTEGVMATMNDYAREARGDYICFAAADDCVLPGYFAEARKLLETHPHAGLCSALSRIVDEAGSDKGIFPSPVPMHNAGYIDSKKAGALMLLDDCWVVGNTAIYRRSALLQEAEFKAELHGFSDGFMHRLIVLRHGACFIPKPYVQVTQRKGSISDRTNTEPDILLAVIAEATNLMATDQEQRFPKGYSERWRRRLLFGAARIHLERGTFVSYGDSLMPNRPQDTFIARCLVAIGARSLAVLYLFVRLRWFDLAPMIQRRLGHLFRRYRQKRPVTASHLRELA